MALDWIRSTFLYIRTLQNPTHYGQCLKLCSDTCKFVQLKLPLFSGFSKDLDRCGIESKLQGGLQTVFLSFVQNQSQNTFQLFFFLLKNVLRAFIELCLRNLNALSSIGLIQMDEDINIKPTGRRKISLNAAVLCYVHCSASNFTSSVQFCSVQRLDG